MSNTPPPQTNVNDIPTIFWEVLEKRMPKLFSIKLLALVLMLVASLSYGQSTEVDADNPMVEELTTFAQSDTDNNNDRRTEFIIELYENNSAGLRAQGIRSVYDNAFSAQVKQNQQQQNTRHITKGMAVFLALGVVAYIVDRKRVLKIKKVSANLPFGIGGVEFETGRNARVAAWKLYVEMRTRIATQQLGEDQGLLREALNSLYKLFQITREILKEAGPDVGVSSQNSVGEIGCILLNRGLRPFTEKWHPKLEVWESKRPENLSAKEHEDQWPDAEKMRQELAELRQELIAFTNSLAKIAGVSPLKLTETQKQD